VRTGYIAAYAQKSEAELLTFKNVDPPGMSGVEQSDKMLKWIWENFSAVAADHPTFECWRMSPFLYLAPFHVPAPRLSSISIPSRMLDGR
jgi:hypothetical protein